MVTVDARNHGKSTHSPILTYEAMTNDLTQLLSQLRIGKCVLIGHSMGGKVAMTTALTQVMGTQDVDLLFYQYVWSLSIGTVTLERVVRKH